MRPGHFTSFPFRFFLPGLKKRGAFFSAQRKHETELVSGCRGSFFSRRRDRSGPQRMPNQKQEELENRFSISKRRKAALQALRQVSGSKMRPFFKPRRSGRGCFEPHVEKFACAPWELVEETATYLKKKPCSSSILKRMGRLQTPVSSRFYSPGVPEGGSFFSQTSFGNEQSLVARRFVFSGYSLQRQSSFFPPIEP